MPYCPKGHGEMSGKYCQECGEELITGSPAPAGEVLRIRSPEARADVHVVLPGVSTEKPAVLVWCPQCGRRNVETEVFDCQGPCGRQNLCLRHFDEEYEVCIQCAEQRRQTEQKRAALQTALQEELAEWRRRAETAESRLAEAVQRHTQAQAELDQARLELRRAREERHAAEAKWQQELAALQAQLAALGAELDEWRRRAGQAEAQLAEIERKEREAEEARRQAEEQKKAAPLWQQIGIELVKIPAGPFLYGDKKQPVELDEFWIAKTPVTNAQYKAFVDATGHRAPSHWKEGRPPPGKENHPVVNVSWHDAQAFCAWVGLRLPSEYEWEKAARGTDGRVYPWGDEWQPGRCNSDEAGIGDTTPVDRFPKGASPYGVLDMAGNVGEWCEGWYDNDRESRVLRGGSWRNSQRGVRAAFRVKVNPIDRHGVFGFRCGLSPQTRSKQEWVVVGHAFSVTTSELECHATSVTYGYGMG